MGVLHKVATIGNIGRQQQNWSNVIGKPALDNFHEPWLQEETDKINYVSIH